MLMQTIWTLKHIHWDDEVPKNIRDEWLETYNDIPRLSEFRLKRWLSTGSGNKIQIHAFCDASQKAYGTAIYVRTINENGEIRCILLSSKSKVAPLQDMTIPRLELLAALMLSEQLEAIINACEFENADVTLWSDSTIVLSWIKKQHTDLKAFVSNRIKKIQANTARFTWKHVSSCDNPADLVSRGMRIQDFLKSRLWAFGPAWLTKPEEEWPEPRLIITPEMLKEINKECKPSIPTEKLLNLRSGQDNVLISDKFQDWNKIVNVTAYVRRIIKKYEHGARVPYSRHTTGLERRQAMEFWIKFEQQAAYKKEIECIKTGDTLPPKSTIAALRPFLDVNGLLRVGGRIDKANTAYSRRHQYVIPPKSRLSYLLLANAHKQTLHGGAQTMMQFIRITFWIPKLRLEAKQYIRTCRPCVRLAQTSASQIMAELPEVRLRPSPPFQHVGVDMAGPYSIRPLEKLNNTTRARRALPTMKGWVAVFVCLVTRSVHLEAVEGMSSEDFLVAYTKFTSRRGTPEKIYSDNGTNFAGAEPMLIQAIKSWESDKIQRHVRLEGTEWHFITPSAPHEGGIWEAAVKQMKHHLKRVMGTQKYSFQGLSALLASVEACLNSRPLCKMSDDPEDIEPLTPAHFLIGRPLKLPVAESSDKPPYTLNRLYVQLQFQVQSFWKQWANDYLHSLKQLPKWREEQGNLAIGQLVVIRMENVPPTYWAMGRVMQTHKGSDGKVRSVTLKTQTGQLERSIRKLCILPGDIELSYWRQIQAEV